MTHPTHGLDPNALEALRNELEGEYGEKVIGKQTLYWLVTAYLASLPRQTAEPVAWRFKSDDPTYDDAYVYCATEEMALLRCPKNSKVEPLYTRPASPPVGGAVDVDVLRNAVLSCGHTITAEEIVLRRSDKQPGNALRQLHERILSALASSERSGREDGVDALRAAVGKETAPGGAPLYGTRFNHFAAIYPETAAAIRKLSEASHEH